MIERKREKRPNILSPTLREKRRYLAFEVISKNKIPFNELSGAMWHACLNFLGEVGTAQSRLWILKSAFEEDRQIGLIRSSHTDVEKIRAALALIDKIGDEKVILRVMGVSGTIKAARKKFFGERDLKSFT